MLQKFSGGCYHQPHQFQNALKYTVALSQAHRHNQNCIKLRHSSNAGGQPTTSSFHSAFYFSGVIYPQLQYTPCRAIHISPVVLDKSKLEDSLKEKQHQILSAIFSPDKEDSKRQDEALSKADAALQKPKPSLWSRFVVEVKHYYHGFRLLGFDMKVAFKTLRKLLRGDKLIRRERKQFQRAVSDIFRLAPFLVFIIIPFAEFALPIALKLFPNMLPSTFETLSKKEARLKKELTVKLEMSKFLQNTVEDIAVRTKKLSKKDEAAQDFVAFFKKVRTTDEEPNNKEILKHAKFFEDQLTLDNMTRPQLIALCRLINVPAVGNNDLLRFLLQMKLNELREDDKMIQEEGVDSLTNAELVTASQARGMRALGLSRERMQTQIAEWVDLHLHSKVPPSLLLLSRVLYLPETIPAEYRVKAAIGTLPDKAAVEAQVRASEVNLERVNNSILYESKKQEAAQVADDQMEAKLSSASKAKQDATADANIAERGIGHPTQAEIQSPTAETLPDDKPTPDKARVISDDNLITQEDINIIEKAISQMEHTGGNDFVVKEAKTELKDLREDVEEYQQDVETLKEVLDSDQDKVVEKDTRASRRIHKRLMKMMGRIDKILSDLDKVNKTESGDPSHITLNDMSTAVSSLETISDEKLERIFITLDTNNDGKVDVEEARKIINVLNDEDVDDFTQQQLTIIVKALCKQKDT